MLLIMSTVFRRFASLCSDRPENRRICAGCAGLFLCVFHGLRNYTTDGWHCSVGIGRHSALNQAKSAPKYVDRNKPPGNAGSYAYAARARSAHASAGLRTCRAHTRKSCSACSMP